MDDGFESVDTVIRDDEPIRVTSFANGIEPATIPSGFLEIEPDPEPDLPPRATEAPAPTGRGKIVCVFGCRGGAGATMLAVNTAASIGKGGQSVVVVDLDLQLGDVFVALDLDAPTSLAALSREIGAIDGAGLRRRLVRHDSGIYALAQTGRLDDIDDRLAERIPALLLGLAGHFEYVIVDGVRDFGDHALAALDAADQIAMVVTQDVQAVRRAARVAQLFRRLGYPERKIHVVLNRHTAKATVDEAEIERVLGLPVGVTVRNDSPRVRKALDEGSLLADTARGTGVHRDVELVARGLHHEPKAREPQRGGARPGFWARLLGRT